MSQFCHIFYTFPHPDTVTEGRQPLLFKKPHSHTGKNIVIEYKQVVYGKITCSCSPKKWTGANNFTGFIFQPLRLAGDRGHDNNVGVCGTSHFARGGVPQTQKLSFRYRHRCLPTDLKISLFFRSVVFSTHKEQIGRTLQESSDKEDPPPLRTIQAESAAAMVWSIRYLQNKKYPFQIL